jgi:hypothetical protein
MATAPMAGPQPAHAGGSIDHSALQRFLGPVAEFAPVNGRGHPRVGQAGGDRRQGSTDSHLQVRASREDLGEMLADTPQSLGLLGPQRPWWMGVSLDHIVDISGGEAGPVSVRNDGSTSTAQERGALERHHAESPQPASATARQPGCTAVSSAPSQGSMPSTMLRTLCATESSRWTLPAAMSRASPPRACVDSVRPCGSPPASCPVERARN